MILIFKELFKWEKWYLWHKHLGSHHLQYSFIFWDVLWAPPLEYHVSSACSYGVGITRVSDVIYATEQPGLDFWEEYESAPTHVGRRRCRYVCSWRESFELEKYGIFRCLDSHCQNSLSDEFCNRDEREHPERPQEAHRRFGVLSMTSVIQFLKVSHR